MFKVNRTLMEIWKDIKDYEGLYQVSNYGRVRNSKGRILKQVKNIGGHLRVGLCKYGKQKIFYVHRLVAEAFIPNTNNLPFINHRDEIPTNNFCGTPENDFNDGNLEWCSSEYNCNYGTRNERISKTMKNGITSKPVLQFTKTCELVREWPSTAECGRNGFSQSNIWYCCIGKLKSHKGYIWKYKKDVV